MSPLGSAHSLEPSLSMSVLQGRFPSDRLRQTHQAVCNGPTSCKERDYRTERDQHVEEYRDDLIKLEVRDLFPHSDQRCAKHHDDLIEFQVADRMSHTDQLSVEHNGTAARHRLRCQQCNISFDTDEILATHFQNTHRHQCSLCEEAFPTKIILSQHITQFHYYPCPKCTWNSQTELELNQHLSEHHSSKCPFASCRLPFETEEDVRLHLAVDHARCGVCKVKFPTVEALQKHRVLAHSRGEGGAWGSASASQNSGGRPQLQHERRGSTSDEDINESSAMDADKGDESDDTAHARLHEVDSEEDEEDEGVFLPEVERGEWGVGFARLLAAAESEDPDTSSTVREPHRNPIPTTFDPIRACKAYRHKCRKCAGVFTTVSGLRHHQATHNHPEHELVYCPLCQRAFTRNGEVDMHLSGTNRLLCPLRDHPDRDRMIAKYEAARRDRARDRPGHDIGRGSSTEVRELPPTRDTPPTATRQQQQRQQRQQQQQPQHRPRTGFRSSTMARLRAQVVADRRRRM
ncbi:hypothetical protein PhCBS80983_g03187 [Powellomyces hirtus]|uniref:C2H2-type domain-containing protein n=1 Tax=Powellomyces hirtus TaxID=109895 RepID=A0A507E3E2_9FUNG|nr:hypothetical protein PhCBS80983_g03187 [Powellomyces hirtus]